MKPQAATHFYDAGSRTGIHNCGPFYINKSSGLLLYAIHHDVDCGSKLSNGAFTSVIA